MTPKQAEGPGQRSVGYEETAPVEFSLIGVFSVIDHICSLYVGYRRDTNERDIYYYRR